MIPQSDWGWMPHPAHFICAFDCRFHLATRIGEVIVSTVGEHFPDAPVREIFAKLRGVKLNGEGDKRKHDYLKRIGFEDIGCSRKFETMVFKAKPNPDEACCPWMIADGMEIDMRGYNDAATAAVGHRELCDAWAARQ